MQTCLCGPNVPMLFATYALREKERPARGFKRLTSLAVSLSFQFDTVMGMQLGRQAYETCWATVKMSSSGNVGIDHLQHWKFLAVVNAPEVSLAADARAGPSWCHSSLGNMFRAVQSSCTIKLLGAPLGQNGKVAQVSQGLSQI